MVPLTTPGAEGSEGAPPTAWPTRDDVDIAASALQFIADALRARRCSLMVLDEVSGGLAIRHAIGLPPEVTASPESTRPSVASRVVRTRAPLLVADVRDHPELARTTERGYRTPSFISVPVADGSGVYGVVNVADREDGLPFTPSDLELLVHLSRHLATCIKNERRQLRAESYSAMVRSLKQRLLSVQEDERARIARELHDEAGQAVAAATFRLDLAAEQLPPDADEVRALLADARRALLECGAQLHRVALNLRPRVLEDLGLIAALRSFLSQFEGGRPRMDLIVQGEERRLDAGLELSVFRLVQEAVTNVRRHARALEGAVVLTFAPGELGVIVRDDGVGFDPMVAWGADGDRPRLGLLGMMERVRLHDGDFNIASAPGQGTTLEFWLPLRAAA